MPSRDQPVRLALPPSETASDVAVMLEATATAISRGVISPGEAAALAGVAGTYIRAIEAAEFDRQLNTLGAAHAAQS
jgi:hypothetical protein